MSASFVLRELVTEGASLATCLLVVELYNCALLMFLGFMLKLQILCELCPAVKLWVCICVTALQQLLHAASVTTCPFSRK